MLAGRLKGAAQSAFPFLAAQSFSGSFGVGVTSYDQPIPTGEIGDYLFISCGGSATIQTMNTPSGWTLVTTLSTSNGRRQTVFFKEATTTSESDINITSASSQSYIAGLCLRYRNASGYIAGTTVAVSGTSVSVPEITMTSKGILLLSSMAGAASRVPSLPSGFDVVFEDSDGTQPSFGVYQKIADSGATGNVTATFTGSGVFNAALIGII
jgi:hypothetical protein